MPYLSRIIVYPIKSFDPISVPQARLVAGGGLEHDREWALFDSEGHYVNGKRHAKVHGLRTVIDWNTDSICFRIAATGQAAEFHLHRDRARLEAWLSDWFEKPVQLRQNAEGGFPDDKNAPGPTVIGSRTLAEVASWYETLTVDEARIRFRANLEITASEPFWEDCLFGAPEAVVRFHIGDVLFEGVNPCQRCIVPTRDSQTGEGDSEFANIFRERREATLPPWADASRFNHFYRLAVNTRIPESEIGKLLRVGDPVIL